MTDEQQSESTHPQATEQTKARAGEGYAIPAWRVTWLRIYLLILLSVAITTLAILLTGDPADRPLWLLLLAAAIAVGCLLLTYALGKAVIRPVPSSRLPQSGPESPPS